jgi:hypothetical protein
MKTESKMSICKEGKVKNDQELVDFNDHNITSNIRNNTTENINTTTSQKSINGNFSLTKVRKGSKRRKTDLRWRRS